LSEKNALVAIAEAVIEDEDEVIVTAIEVLGVKKATTINTVGATKSIEIHLF